MSFGWSAGDIVAAINLLVDVASALSDVDGAKSRYQQDVSYLRDLANVLSDLKTLSLDQMVLSHVSALRDFICEFQRRLYDRFEKDLGKAQDRPWWKDIKMIPRKIQYAIFIHNEVDKLRKQIDIPLKSIIIRLGIASYKISSDIQLSGQSQESLLSRITGAPGSGKTRLATKVIKNFENSGYNAFFYYDGQDQTKQSVINIINNWCWQILRQDLSRCQAVEQVRSKNPVLTLTGLIESMSVLLKDVPDAILLLDGFDECEKREQKELYRILPGISDLAKILVFSRPLQDSFLALKASLNNLTFLEISENDTSSDINQYIESNVASLEIEDTSIAAEIASTLRSNAKGMFLWVFLMFEELQKPRFDETEYLETLNYLPKDINNLYGRILENLAESPQTRSLSRKILEWVLFAKQPLTLKEIGAAMLIKSEEHRWKKSSLSNEKIQKVIVQHCGSLVTIHHSSNDESTVTVVHFSLKEYFLAMQPQDSPRNEFTSHYTPEDVNSRLGAASLQYLCYKTFNPLPYTCHDDKVKDGINETEMEKRGDVYLSQYPLLGYAAVNWSSHVIQPSFDANVYQSLERLLVSSRSTLMWLQILCHFHFPVRAGVAMAHFNEVKAIGEKVPPLLKEWEKWLQPFERPTDFHYSLNKWQKLLLNTKFAPEIHLAAFLDMHEVVQQYLNSGVDVNQRSVHEQRTPLFYATIGCSHKTLELLLSWGADANAIDHLNKTPLGGGMGLEHWQNWESWSARWRNCAMLGLLLDHGADANVKGYENRTALLDCCLITTPSVVDAVKILLDRNASVDAVCDDGHAALHLAVKHDRLLVELLLGAGAPINLQARDGSTPLHDAVLEGNTQIVEVLLSQGASITIRDDEQRTALDLAIENRKTEAMRLLEEKAASFGRAAFCDEMPHASVYNPNENDVFETYFVLRKCFNGLLPGHLIRGILELAQYWSVSYDLREDEIAVMEKDCQWDTPYLVSSPVCGNVKEIRIIVWSHDQGFSSFPQRHGTFEDSWTWFQLGLEKLSGETRILQDPLIINVHASWNLRRSKVVYSAKSPTRPDWIDDLKSGDRLSIIPKAQYPAWKNYVYEASIEVRSSCLLDSIVELEG
ncbi:hypothetical protein N7493_002519 [Penicillium malachiteum]|uniref:NACHT domain-containing protein n=1 Tax=Penicillium malachiteum TaxID=1324776 RepID=A0AAD6HS04_9EURO|nr:hypothetical protein N7493_002519 [Penicillium malachiteum]